MANTQPYPCNTCSVAFETSELQRSHMREPCHVNNVKRRMVQLPALSVEQYEAQLEPLSQDDPPNNADDDQEETSDENNHAIPPIQCLFCPLGSITIDNYVRLATLTIDANLQHMRTAHGLFIPSPDRLVDMDTFLGYLSTVVFYYNTCLYCSTERNSLEGIQTHMRDKGHCMIDLDGDSELDEDGDGDGEEKESVRLTETEMRLPSGAMINSRRADAVQLRSKPALARSRKKGEAQASIWSDAPPCSAQANADRRISVRGEMGISGLSDAQKRGLQVTEKKLKKRETVARAAQRWAVEKVANKQKYFKVCDIDVSIHSLTDADCCDSPMSLDLRMDDRYAMEVTYPRRE
ncbi:hypothetical protein K504DRAFT_509584 [Pleomassaria siparia CBS 279.74]|uniref:C2H2-type domain-containing protein n=1 Tax=Pleomassaria siparia CBS 279.74 TaxID=1314801 RepID=A0A6G1KQI6_9PLEO|nr:hypothetical protein K504DRAFT_509584 [Pleomassaria siparia CBS 279.74]